MEYTELNLHQHTLKRPDTYIGSIREQTTMEYIADKDHISLKEITYIPAIVRLFIEALSNAVDNVHRSIQYDIPCKMIKVDINIESGETSVTNDGLSIPVRQRDDGIWIPEMLFGRLLTSSNYNDDEERMTSGRNGIGISVTNIFSSQFDIDLVDPSTGQQYTQSWSKNMLCCTAPIIKKTRLKRGYTNVRWIPDFQYFGTSSYTNDVVYFMHRHVIDIAMIVSEYGVTVSYNGEKIPMKHFKDYVKLYSNPTGEIMYQYNDFSQCIVIPSSQYKHVSFVNGIYTEKGGVHVDCWIDAICKPLALKINAKYKELQLAPKDCRQYFMIFVTCKVPNPEFTSQSKERLVAPKIKASVDGKCISSLLKWSFMCQIDRIVQWKEISTLKKSEKKKHCKINGFDPANKAGGRESHKCTLLLCEGLSAKTYAVKGINQGCRFNDAFLKGRDYYGILPLQGKLLNCRKATPACIVKNKEIVHIIQALGLQHGVDYSDNAKYKQLHYGRVMILTDQDVDGYHITGLVLNMFDYLFPSLCRRHGFLTCMHTPIMKIIHKQETIRFYDIHKARQYIESNHPSHVEYYKGLGTSSDTDVRETFGKRVLIYNMDMEASNNINIAFNREDSDTRKLWISSFKEDMSTRDDDILDISDFIHNNLLQFSIDDCRRSIPNIMDGLKESNRKILYACILKGIAKPIKVAQLAGFVAEKTNYHHGEACLYETIIGMAQDYVGSNNIALLHKGGQFGCRIHGGKDAASARYIFTKLSDITRSIFHPDDDDILEFIREDGDLLEPFFYIPIIPMILVNGTTGIGTGWSTNIPCFNPRDIILWIKDWLSDKHQSNNIHPWYNGFTGDIIQTSPHTYQTRGIYKQHGNVVTITELPIGIWTDKYKEFLQDLLETKHIKALKNHSTAEQVHFEFIMESKADYESLKLVSTIQTTNLVLFNEHGKIHKYDTIYDILESFCKTRKIYYDLRRNRVYEVLSKKYGIIESKIKFISMVMGGSLILYNRDEKDIITDIRSNDILEIDGGFEYLLSMQMRTFSKQKIQLLESKRQDIKRQIEQIDKTTVSEMWIHDLDNIKL